MSEHNLISARVSSLLGDKPASKQDVASLINAIVNEIKTGDNSNLGKFKSVKLPSVPMKDIQAFIKPNSALHEKAINFFKLLPDPDLSGSVISLYMFLLSYVFPVTSENTVRFFTFPVMEKTVKAILQITAPTYKKGIYILAQKNLVKILLYSASAGIVYEIL